MAIAAINPHRLKNWHMGGPVANGYAARIFADAGEVIADVPRMITEANEQGIACLISAAPELLTALEAANERFAVLDDADEMTREDRIVWKQMQAAIKKARVSK